MIKFVFVQAIWINIPSNLLDTVNADIFAGLIFRV